MHFERIQTKQLIVNVEQLSISEDLFKASIEHVPRHRYLILPTVGKYNLPSYLTSYTPVIYSQDPWRIRKRETHVALYVLGDAICIALTLYDFYAER